MQPHEPNGIWSKSPAADNARRPAALGGFQRGRNEPVLRELLAEAHARIRVLEQALDRVKNTV
jgi:hypothetical protein